MPLRYLENPAYERGPRLSLWTGRELFRRDDVLLADADVLFALALLQRVVGAPASNVFLALAGLSRHGRGGGPVLPRPHPGRGVVLPAGEPPGRGDPPGRRRAPAGVLRDPGRVGRLRQGGPRGRARAGRRPRPDGPRGSSGRGLRDRPRPRPAASSLHVLLDGRAALDRDRLPPRPPGCRERGLAPDPPSRIEPRRSAPARADGPGTGGGRGPSGSVVHSHP